MRLYKKICHSGKFSLRAAKENLSGIRFGFLPIENQMGFRINFLSPKGEEKILRNDDGVKVLRMA
jgi:hypothetical protein